MSVETCWSSHAPKETISAFDIFLAGRQLTLDAVVVGGAALGLLGVIKRETRDRGLDLQDCIALAPTPGDLDEITTWLEHQDANPDWPNHVRAVLADLQGRLRHGV